MWAAWTMLFLGAQPGVDFEKLEAWHLRNIRQVTFGFVRAGEGYFAPDGKHIIFQAEEKGDNPFYQMFVQDLETRKFHRVSPGIGKTTCGYFSPDGKKIIFASSHLDPDAKKHYAAEKERREQDKAAKKRRRYAWDFDPYMEIYEATVDGGNLKRLTNSPGYDAEGSYSPDGKQIVFCSNRGGKDNLELYIMDSDGGNVRQLTKAPGCYNGGPFFSPDGKRVIFRSDRKKKGQLQLYVIDVDGTGERALTDDQNCIFWAPFWYKDSHHIVYTAMDHSAARPDYDLYWRNIDDDAKPIRLTFAPGADVLPVFNSDGTKLMWTSVRGDNFSSQLYIADFTPPDAASVFSAGLSAFKAPHGDWQEVAEVAMNPSDLRKLQAKPGQGGIWYNGPNGRTKDLVTKKNYGDVEVEAEFMIPKGSNSGIKLHGHYEIQIVDSWGVKELTGDSSGGIYPRAELTPRYHHIDKGIAPKVNACKQPGEWQTMTIAFQAPRFDAQGKKTANARLVKVVFNGQVIHDNQELLTPTGHLWKNAEMAEGPLMIQATHGPVAFRKLTVRPLPR